MTAAGRCGLRASILVMSCANTDAWSVWSPAALRWVATELPLRSSSLGAPRCSPRGTGGGAAGAAAGRNGSNTMVVAAKQGATPVVPAKGAAPTAAAAGPFRCNICGRTFSRNDSLAHHKSVHTGRTRCPVCGVLFTRKYTMKCHLFTAHGIK